MEKSRNYEFRTLPFVSYIEVSRDGELRYQKGKTQYRNGMARRPEEFLKNEQGEPMTIQMMIHLAFPDIPMRITPTR